MRDFYNWLSLRQDASACVVHGQSLGPPSLPLVVQAFRSYPSALSIVVMVRSCASQDSVVYQEQEGHTIYGQEQPKKKRKEKEKS